MKKELSLLLCLLMTISLVSCALSGDGGSSLPTGANPESDTVFSSDTYSSTNSGDSSKDSSREEKPESSKTESEKPTSSKESSSEIDNTFSYESSSSEPTSSVGASSESESSSAQSSSNETSSNTTPKPDIKPVSEKDYYGYSKLSDAQKQAYDKILSVANDMPSGFIELGATDRITQSDVYLVAITLKNDHPEIFWLPYSWYIGETHNRQLAILFANETQDNVGGDIESFTATYVVERAKKQTMQKELETAVKDIKSKITATEPYEIELQIHDILCERITYVSEPEPSPLAYTAYGALVEGKALCEGYSRAFQLLLYEFGINSTLVTGYAGQEHMWNLVQIDEKWYHADVTWNDQESGIRHTYFNLTDPAIRLDHIINTDFENLTASEVIQGQPFNFSLPVCNSIEANYFEKTGYMLPRDMEKLVSEISSCRIKSAEVTGWNEQVKETLESKLRQKGFNDPLKYVFDGSWAVINTAN